MEDVPIIRNHATITRTKTFRDAVMPAFRQKKLVCVVFVCVFVGATAGALLTPRKYEAEMKILVNRDRIDAVVTPDQDAPVAAAPTPVVTEEDLNSEVELLKSRDLLEEVVAACRLEPSVPSRWGTVADRVESALRIAPPANETTRRARAVESLDNNLMVEPLKKTNLIRVSYVSHDPELSARVLQILATLYQEKHAAVHRPEGTFGFFDDQASRYEESLRTAEARLAAFDGTQGMVDPAMQEQLTLQRLSDFESEWQREEANVSAAQRRAGELQSIASSTPERQTTQKRASGNAELLSQLQSALLSLQLKRNDMLTKYADSYPPVQELATEIADAQSAITAAEGSPVEEITTDRVPAQDWIATELAKAQADRAATESQAAATARTVEHYRRAALHLDREGAERSDLVRNVKTAEENYLLYQRKREAARISDALDSKRIVNVSIAEAATVPALPTLHFGWLLIGGFFAASTLAVGSAYAADRLSPGFRSPDEIGQYLDLQVLASIPAVVSEHTTEQERRFLL